MKTKVALVTPEMAKDWLLKNEVNRKLRPGFVEFLASEIKRGCFQLTHQGIAFDEHNKLIDGQHRLYAIVQANQAVEMMITFDVPSYKFNILDTGIARTASDILKIPASFVQVYRCLRDISNKHVVGRQSIEALRKLDDSLHDKLVSLESYCKGNNRYYSSAAFRSAVLVTWICGGRKEYVFELYKGLVYQHLDCLPPVGQALIRYLFHHPFAIKGTNARWEAFCIAMYVFDEANQYNAKLRINQSHKDKYLALASKLVTPNGNGK